MANGIKFLKPKTMPTRELNQLYPIVEQKVNLWLAECKKQGLPVIVTQTYRSAEYQHSLYLIGRTPATAKKAKLTNADSGHSMHEFRCAVDFCINIKGKAYDTAMINKAGKLAQKFGFTWGGDWNGNGKADEKFIDRPHVQYTGGYTEDQIRAGKIPVK